MDYSVIFTSYFATNDIMIFHPYSNFDQPFVPA